MSSLNRKKLQSDRIKADVVKKEVKWLPRILTWGLRRNTNGSE